MLRPFLGLSHTKLIFLVHNQNYTADWIQALTWGLSAGLNTPITFFYPAFFMTVLIHRCGRDFERCARKYGDE